MNYALVKPARWTDENIAAWEAEYSRKPFADVMRELGTPYRALPSGVPYRDRRAAAVASA